jgi:PKD repeat protein
MITRAYTYSNARLTSPYIYSLWFDSGVDDFSASSTVIRVGKSVQFNIITSHNIDSYLWNFGDGGTSAEAAPVHTYNSKGVKNVSVTIFWGTREATISKSEYITVMGKQRIVTTI